MSDQSGADSRRDRTERVAIRCGNCGAIYVGRRCTDGRLIPLGRQRCRCGDGAFTALGSA